MRLPVIFLVALSLVLTTANLGAPAYAVTDGWQDSFNLEDCKFSSTGSNNYFFLKPGYQLVLEGEEDGEQVQLTITVLNETKMVDGTETRIVEERQIEDGELVEVSKNYFAVCGPDNNIFYFGEAVDNYEDGKIINHDGAWLAGEDEARPGIIIPSQPKVGMKYYQEIAKGIAEDRAEILSLSETLDTPAGKFENVLKVEETTPLEPGVKEYKLHAPGVGLIQDGPLKLVKYVLPKVESGNDNGGIGVDLKTSLETVKLAANTTVQVEIQSSSEISDFSFDTASKRISFKVTGDNGTQGTTIISVGGVLKGPYSVSINGQPISDFETMKSGVTGETSIKLTYGHSPKEVVITGTEVVPEFSAISALILAISVMAMIGLAMFSKKILRKGDVSAALG
jgi:hypothetical protein